jgi:sterol desaturase/sphingolipid hydroxylase (fatty acid hydroxylase superfamily)
MAVTHKPQQGQGRMFENDILEALSKTSAAVAYTYYPAVVLGMLAVNLFYHHIHWMSVLGFYVWGVLFFTFFEYLVHRYIYHIDDSGSDRMKRFAERYHGIHHDYPQDKERLIMPPLVWTVLVAFLLGLAYLIGGQTAFSFIAGLVTGYLGYIFVHYQVHTSNPPRWLKSRMMHHAKHHYQFEDKAFGVSTNLWDKVFGTMPPR